MTTKKDQSPAKAATDEAIKGALYSEALRELRDAHKEEFVALVSAKFQARGLVYKPRLNAEERAREQILRLAAAAGLDVSFVVDPDPTVADPRVSDPE